MDDINATVQQVFNAMMTFLLARFMINDVPHAIGLLDNPSSKQPSKDNPKAPREIVAYNRWQQIKRYLHTIDDIRRIANRQGIIKLYHGAPTEFAELLVTQGPRVPYRVEDTGRYVARVYGIPWVEFRPYAYRAHEVVEKLSTAPAAIAARWAWTFPLGEVLTDLNAHARMFVAFKEKAIREGISLDDAYDQLYEEAIQVARGTGARCTTESAPDVLGLPDKLALQKKAGALVEIGVDARALPERIVRDAVIRLGYIDKGETTEQETVLYWNHEYTDIKVAAENVRSSRIVISGMQSWEQDLVEEIIKKELASM